MLLPNKYLGFYDDEYFWDETINVLHFWKELSADMQKFFIGHLRVIAGLERGQLKNFIDL